VANGRCNKIIREERCHGINQRATNIADWEECASCSATGFERNKICSLCRGVGFYSSAKSSPLSIARFEWAEHRINRLK